MMLRTLYFPVLPLIMLVGMNSGPEISWGQDIDQDITFRYSSGAIELASGLQVYEGTFPTSGFSKQFTTDPGFASETDIGLGIQAHDRIAYNVLDHLLFWNGSTIAPAPSGTFIRIVHAPDQVPETVIDAQSAPTRGSFDPPLHWIGEASALGDFHAHGSFELVSLDSLGDPTEPPVGAYGIALSLSTSAVGVRDSAPFLIVFNYGLTPSDFEAGVEAFRPWLTPSVCDLNGDRAVDAADAGIMFGNWTGSGLGDCNQDGIVDAADAGILFGEWTGDAGPSVMLVPEPGTLAASAVALTCLARPRTGRRRTN